MGIEIILHERHLQCLWERFIHQGLHLIGIINSCASWGDLNMPPADQWCHNHEQITHSIALVFRVIARRLTGLNWSGGLLFNRQLLIAFVKTHHWIVWIFRAVIHIKDILQLTNKFSISFGRYHPTFIQPRFQLVFFRV